MRTAGTVFRKLKEVKFRHLIVLYRQHLRHAPENCRYNYLYRFVGEDGREYPIRLCLLHQDECNQELMDGQGQLLVTPHLIDVCQAQGDCQDCNAFVLRHTRESVKDIFDKELGNRTVKEAKYPDICALEWVLERPAVGMPPLGWFLALLFQAKLFLKNKIF